MLQTKLRHHRRPVVVIGCDAIGSAIACVLHRAGAAVVIVDAADPPWARRGMSYTDAWYVGGATLDAIDACFCGSVRSIPAILDRGDMIAATTWSWEGVAVALDPVAVVDTRAARAPAAVARRPASLDGVLAIGVGTTRVGGWRADIVVAPRTAGAETGHEVSGEHRCAHASAARIDAPHGGRFRTRHQIAERVDAGDIVGELGAFAVVAPMAGVVTALAARGARIAPGHTLAAEIDPRGDEARCFGITARAQAIGHQVAAALRKTTQPSSRPPPAIERQALPA